MEVRFIARDATPQQRVRGGQAARAVLQASGLSPLAARNAFAEVVGAARGVSGPDAVPSPASVRAARVWSLAFDAAVRACFGRVVRPLMADLDIAEEGEHGAAAR
jgi:hypothetical protein